MTPIKITKIGLYLPRISVLIFACLLLFTHQAHAQERPNERPNNTLGGDVVEATEDTKLFGAIFGSIAYAAAGLVDIEDIANGVDEDGNSVDRPDSAIAAMMNIYLITVLIAAVIGLMVLAFFAITQSALKSEALSRHYGVFSSLRSLYGVIAIMPLVGGWSLGQWGIFNVQFFGMDAANRMNLEGAKWTYSGGSAKAISLPQGPITKITENIILSEVCAKVVNRFYEKQNQEIQEAVAHMSANASKVADIADITQSRSMLIQSAYLTAAERIERSRINLPDYIVTGKFHSISSETTHKLLSPSFNPLYGTYGRIDPEVVTTTTKDPDYNFVLAWGSPRSKIDSCGHASFEMSMTKDKRAQGPRSKEIARVYTNTQKNALDQLKERALEDTDAAVKAIQKLEALKSTLLSPPAPQIPPDQAQINRKILASFGSMELRVRALAPLIDHNLKLTASQEAYDQYFASLRNAYYSAILAGHNTAMKKQNRVFDDLMKRLALTQRANATMRVIGSDVFNPEYGVDSGAVTKNLENESFEELYHPIILNASKGWMYAGFRWMDLSRSAELTMSLSKEAPSFSPFYAHTRAFPEMIQVDLGKTRKLVNAFGSYRTAAEQFQRTPNTLSADLVSKLAQEYDGDIEGALGKYQSLLGEFIISQLSHGIGYGDNRLGGLFEFNERDLLYDLQDTGHSMLWAAEALAVLAIAIPEKKSGSNLGGLKKPGGFKAQLTALAVNTVSPNLTEAIAKLTSLSALILFALGMILTVYLPMQPAINFVFALVDYVRKTIEVILAQPIWHAIHLIPGEDTAINQAARHGYITVAALAVTPPVIILSLYFSHATISSFGALLYFMIDSYLPSMHKGFVTGVPVALGTLGVFVLFLIALVNRILAFIYQIIENLPAYFGGGALGLGTSESAGRFAEAIYAFQAKSERVGGSIGPSSNPNQSPLKRQRNKGFR